MKRIRDEDLISDDRENWRKLKHIKPLQLDQNGSVSEHEDTDEFAYFMQTLNWSSEHLSKDEDYEEGERSELSSHDRDAYEHSKRERNVAPWKGGVLFLSLIVIIVSVSLLLPRQSREKVADCMVNAMPAVNWSNCRMERRDLTGVDLTDALLRNTNLHEASLRGAILNGSDLAYSNLRFAMMGESQLVGADLRGADLGYANLQGAELKGADLSYADLSFANIQDADFSEVRLDRAIWIDGRLCQTGSVGQCL